MTSTLALLFAVAIMAIFGDGLLMTFRHYAIDLPLDFP